MIKVTLFHWMKAWAGNRCFCNTLYGQDRAWWCRKRRDCEWCWCSRTFLRRPLTNEMIQHDKQTQTKFSFKLNFQLWHVELPKLSFPYCTFYNCDIDFFLPEDVESHDGEELEVRRTIGIPLVTEFVVNGPEVWRESGLADRFAV